MPDPDSINFYKEAFKVVKEFSATGESTISLKRIKEISPDLNGAILDYLHFHNWASQIIVDTITIDSQDIPVIMLHIKTRLRNLKRNNVSFIMSIVASIAAAASLVLSIIESCG